MMRPFANHSLLILGALACGGWVCQSNADNRCPGALTCDIEVANACCPFERPFWCDGCTDDDSECTRDNRSCSDLARVLECSFSAKIQVARCVALGTRDNGTELWMLEVAGELTGCGEEVAFISLGSDRDTDPSCGSWSSGVYGGCVPAGDDISTTIWSLSRMVERGAGDRTPIDVAVHRGHGANPVLAMAQFTCTR